MDLVKVVVRYADGRVVKGFTNNFFPNRPVFHLKPPDSDSGVEISVRDLKAVFFVKDFAGNPAYNEKKDFSGEKKPTGRRVEVTFTDGETLVGSTLGYDPARPGFFITPPDEQSNNIRVFVVSSAVRGFRYL